MVKITIHISFFLDGDIMMKNTKLYDEYIALKNELESMDINDDMDYYLDLKNEINKLEEKLFQ